MTGWVAGALRLQLAREAIESVALSHRDECLCLACRASHGDTDAMAQLLEFFDRLESADADDD